MITQIYSCTSSAIVVALLITVPGCGKQEQITQYRAPAEPRQVVAMPAPRGQEPAQPQRMLAAIVIDQSKAWFFKATGSVEQIGAIADSFQAFIRSVRFEGGAPRWSLPDGWNELKNTNSLRFATLDAMRVELSVSTLDVPTDKVAEYTLANVNRWRTQLRLPPLPPEGLAENTRQVKTEHIVATIMDATGIESAGLPPTSGGVNSAATAPSTNVAPVGDSKDASVVWKVPDTWQPGTSSAMRLASYKVSGENGQAEVTVIGLGPAAGDLLSNVNRWRDQIGLASVDEAAVAAATSELDVDGTAAKYVRIEEENAAKSTLVILVPKTDRTWFLKFSGDKVIVTRETANFEQFAKSISLP